MYTPDPASDNTQGESVILCKPRDSQAWKLLDPKQNRNAVFTEQNVCLLKSKISR